MRHKSLTNMTRRTLLAGAASLGASGMLSRGVLAEELSIWEQMARNRLLRETDRDGNTTRALAAIDTYEPVLSLDTAYNLELAIAKYEQIVANGGWAPMPREIFRLVAGNTRRAVKNLQRRLILTGDMPADARVHETFDSATDLGLRTFQARHGLVVDGKVGDETFLALAVPADYRLAQLRLNVQRIERMARDLSDRYVVVNIPAALIEAIDVSTVAQRHTAVVGRIDRPTPTLRSKIYEINFNPYWHVPKSIIRRDLIRYMNEDPNYLTNYRIKIYDSSGRELRPSDIDWTTDEAVQYAFRQEPGAENSLGYVRINFRNAHSVYLHDTPGKSLFGQNRRFNSSGCVRVENVDAFVAWLLQSNGGWDVQAVNAAFQSGERRDVRIAEPVPIQLTYVTAWANRQGTVSFRDDVYEFDAQGRIEFDS